MKKTAIHIALLILLSAVFIATREQWMNTMAEFIASSMLIALAGIPHGSLDHKIALHRNKRLRLPLFLLQYIASAVFYLLVWAIAPGLALILFLILTAWHFGETDFVIFGCRKKPGWMIFLYGWSLTIWLLGQDSAALMHWLGIITRASAVTAHLIRFITFLPIETWYLVLGLIILLNGAPGRWRLLVRCTFLLFIYLLSKTSLLTGFILYFAGWHSLNALFHIRTRVFRKSNLSSMMKQAIPTTMAALAFLLIVSWLSNGAWLQNHGLPALFILLSILTLPHMTEMHRLYARRT